jgi:short-subunit dehydrogenase
MNLELKGHVVVEGASKGLGLACAMAYARQHALVIGVSRLAANLSDAREQMEALGLTLRTRPT